MYPAQAVAIRFAQMLPAEVEVRGSGRTLVGSHRGLYAVGSGILMPLVHYSATQKAEAIALCRVVGTKEASTRIRMSVTC